MQKLIYKYLFSSHKIQDFLCNDLFVEFDKIVDKKLIFSKQNSLAENRRKNYNKIVKTVQKFLNENDMYFNRVLQLYKSTNKQIIDKIILAYIYFIFKTNKEYLYFNFLSDKFSVCYNNKTLLFLQENENWYQ